MTHPLSEYVNIFITLIAIVDPLGVIPIFITLTQTKTRQYQNKTAWISAVTVAIVLIASVLIGETLLNFFGISIASFRVAGGLLLLLMGINMLHARQVFSSYNSDNTMDENIAVVPLAIPLLSGPGAISTMTIFAHRDLQWNHLTILIGISLMVAIITWGVLFLAQKIGGVLGKTGLNITVRLMGLLLSAAAVQFMADGITQFFCLK